MAVGGMDKHLLDDGLPGLEAALVHRAHRALDVGRAAQ